MKNIFLKIIIICVWVVFSVSLLLCLASCKNKYNGSEVSLVAIGGRHANLASYEYPEIVFYEADSEQAFLKENERLSSFIGIVADGEPMIWQPRKEDDITANTSFAKSVQNKRWDSTQKYAKKLLKSLFKDNVSHEELNTLEAFHQASNFLSDKNKKIQKRIVVCDSGLCTTGMLNFIENNNLKTLLMKDSNITEQEVQQIVDELSKKNEIPNLADVQIQWHGIGYVGGKQNELSKTSINNLTEIWQGILKEAGAFVDFVPAIKVKSELSDDELPMVSVVLFDTSESLGEDELGFEPGTPDFLKGTEDKRSRVLQKFLQEGKNNGLLLVGTTSDGGYGGDGLFLSEQRAKAVKNELELLGVPANKIQMIWLGTKHHKYDSGEFENGEYKVDSEAAQRNRSVWIMSLNCKDANLFKQDWVNLKK